MSSKTRCKRIRGGSSKSGLLNGEVEALKNLAGQVLNIEEISRQAKLFKALADETRLKIIRILVEKPLCVCELMAALNLTQPTASHHLQILENAGLIREEKQGKRRVYHIISLELAGRLFEFK